MTTPILLGHECAVCGALKRDVNHWWLVSVADGAVAVLAVTKWHPTLAAFSGRRPTCGHNCTQKLVERWLITGSLDPSRSAVGNPVEWSESR